MFKTIALSAVAALTAATMVPGAAEARPRDNGQYYGNGYYQPVQYRGYRGDRGYRGNYRGDRGYRGDYYRGDRYYGGGQRYYGGQRHRCRDSGTGGTIIGAIAGGLLGNEVGKSQSYRRDGTTGAIVGAGVGALAGRAIDRNC